MSIAKRWAAQQDTEPRPLPGFRRVPVLDDIAAKARMARDLRAAGAECRDLDQAVRVLRAKGWVLA